MHWRCPVKRRFAVLVVMIATFAMVALTFGMPIPARGAGEPVPPFEDETWRIMITHSDEYWLNMRYLVFSPGWEYDDTGFSGAHVTGHSGCGEPHAPMLVNTAFAAEGEHDIVVYFGGHCTHEDDPGEETKYDRYPNGTQIAIDATLEHFLAGESTPVETIPIGVTATVTTDARPPVYLWSLQISHIDLQSGVAVATTSPTTTDEPQGTPEGVSEDVEADPDAVVESSGEDIDAEGGSGPSVIALILAAVLLLLLLGVITMAKITRGRRDTPEPSPPQPESENQPPDSAPSSAEPEPVAEEHIADLFGDMATREIGKLPPVSPPTGRLRPGWEWIWVTHPTKVSYTSGLGYSPSQEVENTLQPGHWYQGGPKNMYGSRTVVSEDAQEMLGDQVFDVRPRPTTTEPLDPPT